MYFDDLKLSGAHLIRTEPKGDDRGRLTRLFCAREFERIGLKKPIVNVNHTCTTKRGTVRGLHFQYPPDCEIKIVRCLRGAVWDCIVDLRKASPTFLQWEAVELTERNDRMIFVPEGFAHGFQTLTDDVEMLYFHTAYYNPDNEGGIRFDDPALSIPWPLEISVVSDRDRSYKMIDRFFEGISIR